jgi:hypothetical protein
VLNVAFAASRLLSSIELTRCRNSHIQVCAARSVSAITSSVRLSNDEVSSGHRSRQEIFPPLRFFLGDVVARRVLRDSRKVTEMFEQIGVALRLSASCRSTLWWCWAETKVNIE